MRYFIFLLGLCVGITPICVLAYNVFAQNYGAEPTKRILHFLGDWSIYFILIAVICPIFCTLLKSSFAQKNLRILAKIFGLFGLVYALLHFFAYVVFEQDGNLKNTMLEIWLRIYLFIGFWGLLGLVVLGIFSLFCTKYFYNLSKLSYLAGLLCSVHYLLGQKIPSITSYIIFMVFLILVCAKLLGNKSQTKELK